MHFHPVAKNILLTTSRDVNVKFFDLEHKKESISIEGTHSDMVQSITWNWDGSTLVTSCKDKIMRIWDPRNKKVTAVSVLTKAEPLYTPYSSFLVRYCLIR